MLGELMIYLSLEKVPKVGENPCGKSSHFQGLVIAARDLEVEAGEVGSSWGAWQKKWSGSVEVSIFCGFLCVYVDDIWYMIYDDNIIYVYIFYIIYNISYIYDIW